MNITPPYLYIAIIAAAGPACGTHSNNTGDHSNAVCASASATTPSDTDTTAPYLIAGNLAGPFRIGATIPDSVAGFIRTDYTENAQMREETPTATPAYVYEIGNEGWVMITPQYDPATGHANDIVGDIFVYSDLFLTEKGIGAMSSLKDFASAYPDFNIRFDPGNDCFIVETHQIYNVQFLLQSEHYTGSADDLASSGSAGIRISDFKENAFFTAIRICS